MTRPISQLSRKQRAKRAAIERAWQQAYRALPAIEDRFKRAESELKAAQDLFNAKEAQLHNFDVVHGIAKRSTP